MLSSNGQEDSFSRPGTPAYKSNVESCAYWSKAFRIISCIWQDESPQNYVINTLVFHWSIQSNVIMSRGFCTLWCVCLQARDLTELPFFSFFLFWSSECNDGVLEGRAFLSPPACDIYACSSFSRVLGGSHCCLLGCRGWLCRLQSMSSYEHIKLGRLHLLKEISSFIRIGGSVGLQSAQLAVEALYGHFLPGFLYLLVRTDGV